LLQFRSTVTVAMTHAAPRAKKNVPNPTMTASNAVNLRALTG
jgi:hypothetical protein